MITAIYIIAAACIILGMAFSRGKLMSGMLGVCFLGIQTLLTVHAMLNPGCTELQYFTFDSLALILILVLTIVSYPALFHSRVYLDGAQAGNHSRNVYNASYLLLITAMTLGYAANHLAMTWIFTEVTTLSAAMLIYQHRTKLALEATWKYVFVCAISICFVFVGILFVSLALLSAGSADLSYDELAACRDSLDMFWMKLGFVFIFAGYTAKLGLFPMFTAGIDAKDKAPAPAGALLASALMNLGFCGIFRVYAVLTGTPVAAWARAILIVASLLTLFIATAYMIRIRNVKRMLAYSGIEHMSVVTLGLAFGQAGMVAALLHMVMHTFVKSGLFFHFTQIWKTYKSKMLDDMGDYLSLNPFGALVLLLGFVSITAIPPSGLFFSELLVFKAMIAEGSWVVFILTAFLLTVLIWAFARSIFRIIFLPAAKTVEGDRVHWWESLSQLILFALAAYIGFNPPTFLMTLIQDVASMIS